MQNSILEQAKEIFTVFLNKFLKHVFNMILKLNNDPWKKVYNYFFFVEKNDAQISRAAVMKKAPSSWKNIRQDLDKDKTYQTMCGNFIFRWFFGSKKLFFTKKLFIKLDQQKIKKILHTVLETIISKIIL